MGLLSFLSGGSGNTKDLQALTASLQPYLADLNKYSQYGFEQGKADYTKAGQTLDIPINYYKDILGGDFDKILKSLNSDEVISNYDDQTRLINEMGLRGGNRAASSSLNEFNKQKLLNEAFQKIRSDAPQHLEQLGAILAQIAQGKLSLTGNTKDIISSLLNLQQFREMNKDRRAGAIQGLLNTLSGVSGAIAGGA